MTVSTKLQSKISRTKKRLFEDRWSQAAWILAVLGLFVVLTGSMRAVMLSRSYGAVSAELPVLRVPLEDPGRHRFSPKFAAALKRTTATVLLTADAFYFGEMKAFSEDFGDPRSKFIIRHVDQEPQLQTLVSTMDRWFAERLRESQIRSDGVVVFAPSGEIPMPVVIQVMDGLRASQSMQRVVLAAGLL